MIFSSVSDFVGLFVVFSVTLRLWGVNGAAHHTIHHTKFNYNYGQYFTFWDQFFNTFKDPYQMWPYNMTEKDKEQLKKSE